MNRQYRVIAGPHRLARKYAESRGWGEDEYIIVTRGHQLARLDPALVAAIIMVKLNHFGQRIAWEIKVEIDRMRTLWSVPMLDAA